MVNHTDDPSCGSASSASGAVAVSPDPSVTVSDAHGSAEVAIDADRVAIGVRATSSVGAAAASLVETAPANPADAPHEGSREHGSPNLWTAIFDGLIQRARAERTAAPPAGNPSCGSASLASVAVAVSADPSTMTSDAPAVSSAISADPVVPEPMQSRLVEMIAALLIAEYERFTGSAVATAPEAPLVPGEHEPDVAPGDACASDTASAIATAAGDIARETAPPAEDDDDDVRTLFRPSSSARAAHDHASSVADERVITSDTGSLAASAAGDNPIAIEAHGPVAISADHDAITLGSIASHATEGATDRQAIEQFLRDDDNARTWLRAVVEADAHARLPEHPRELGYFAEAVEVIQQHAAGRAMLRDVVAQAERRSPVDASTCDATAQRTEDASMPDAPPPQIAREEDVSITPDAGPDRLHVALPYPSEPLPQSHLARARRRLVQRGVFDALVLRRLAASVLGEPTPILDDRRRLAQPTLDIHTPDPCARDRHILALSRKAHAFPHIWAPVARASRRSTLPAQGRSRPCA